MYVYEAESLCGIALSSVLDMLYKFTKTNEAKHLDKITTTTTNTIHILCDRF